VAWQLLHRSGTLSRVATVIVVAAAMVVLHVVVAVVASWLTAVVVVAAVVVAVAVAVAVVVMVAWPPGVVVVVVAAAVVVAVVVACSRNCGCRLALRHVIQIVAFIATRTLSAIVRLAGCSRGSHPIHACAGVRLALPVALQMVACIANLVVILLVFPLLVLLLGLAHRRIIDMVAHIATCTNCSTIQSASCSHHSIPMWASASVRLTGTAAQVEAGVARHTHRGTVWNAKHSFGSNPIRARAVVHLASTVLQSEAHVALRANLCIVHSAGCSSG